MRRLVGSHIARNVHKVAEKDDLAWDNFRLLADEGVIGTPSPWSTEHGRPPGAVDRDRGRAREDAFMLQNGAMTPSLDLATLRVIVQSADLGSISAASDSMQLAVAAASSRISSMEEALGFRIFERTARGVRVTPAGHMLVQRSRELLRGADRLAVDLQDYSKGLQGNVRVLANASAILEVLAPRLDEFIRRHPLIHIDLEEMSSPDMALPLLEGRADLGIVDLPQPPLGLDLSDFFSDTLVLIVAASHALAGRESLTLREALGEHFITLTDGTALSNRLLVSAAELGRPIHIRMRMRSFDAVCRMVACGLGVGVLPLQAVAPQLAHLPICAVRLSEAWAHRTHRLAVRAGVPLSPAARTLVHALRA